MGPALIRIRPCLQELVDHRRAAFDRRQVQRSGALAIGRLHVRPGCNQEIRQDQIVVIGSPLNRGGSVRLGSVHVRFLLDQCAHSSLIVLHGRIRNRTVRRAKCRERRH